MITLHQLILRNFRGIRELRLDLHAQLTVLVGANTAGKTSVLDALALAARELVEEPSPRPVDVPALPELRATIVRNTSTFDVTNGAEQGRIELRGSASGDGFDVQVALTPSIAPRGYSKIETSGKFRFVAERVTERLRGGQNEDVPVFLYYRDDRAVQAFDVRILKSDELDPAAAYSGALGGLPNFRTFFSWFRTREDVENENRQKAAFHRDPQLEACRRAIAHMLPGYTGLTVRRLEDLVVLEREGKEFVINQLSTGERNLLVLAGDIARRLAMANPAAKDPLTSSGVLLIDELELHLHPGWQRLVVPRLREAFPGLQLVVTTHSPQVLSVVGDSFVYVLHRTDDDGVGAARADDPNGKDSNWILQVLMGVDERPPEAKALLNEYLQAIGRGQSEAAQNIKMRLVPMIGSDDPVFAKAEAILRTRELLTHATDHKE